ncbi:MAG: hypothetical protein ABR962_02125 [Candidatus Bathyarchaeia archaeon]
MKLWKVFLIAISVAILPFALVGVGQAQQMNCWGLTPCQTEKAENANHSGKGSPQKREILRNVWMTLVTALKTKNMSKQ